MVQTILTIIGGIENNMRHFRANPSSSWILGNILTLTGEAIKELEELRVMAVKEQKWTGNRLQSLLVEVERALSEINHNVRVKSDEELREYFGVGGICETKLMFLKRDLKEHIGEHLTIAAIDKQLWAILGERYDKV